MSKIHPQVTADDNRQYVKSPEEEMLYADKDYKSDDLCFGGETIVKGLKGNIDPKTDTCYPMSDKTFKKDTIYERSDIKAIVFRDSAIRCKKADRTSCSITFKLTMKDANTAIILTDHSLIEGREIVINSPTTLVQIDDTSSIDADGGSHITKG